MHILPKVTEVSRYLNLGVETLRGGIEDEKMEEKMYEYMKKFVEMGVLHLHSLEE